MPFHVVGGDLVRDALVAQSRNQPIEQRRGIVAPDGRGNSLSPQVSTNIWLSGPLWETAGTVELRIRTAVVAIY